MPIGLCATDSSAHWRDHGVDPLVKLAGRHPSGRAEEAEQAARGHVGVERAVFGQVAQVLGRADPVGLDVDAGDPGRAVRRRDEAGQEPHRRRLARPVGPEEGDDLALGDRERHVPDRQERAELLAEPIGFDHHGL